MRILLATEVFAPSVGGTEQHVAALGAALLRAGHDPIVATTSPALGHHDDGELPVVRLRGWAATAIRRQARPEQRFHPPAADPGLVHALAELATRSSADVIHAHGWMAHSAVPAARRAGVPVVVSLHDYGLDCARRSRQLPDGEPCAGPHPSRCRSCAAATYGAVRGPLVLAGLQRSARWWSDVDAFVANGDAVAAAARAAGVRCDVVSPWIAPPAGAIGDPVPDLPVGPFVLYVGALAAHKGIATLTEAWAEPPAPIVALVSRPAAGAPPLPPGAIVHEHVPHAQVLGTLARATVTVAPSTYPEPFGLVAAEAMWAGSPVIASAVGGLADVLDHGQAGVLVAPGDAGALRAAVVEVLADSVRRAELVGAGRRRAAELDGTEAVLRTYRRVIGRQPQASPASLRT